jgi:hypothetical protein
MATRRSKSKSSESASLDGWPADLAAVVRGKTMDLSGVSLFCRRQAECAALFGSIVQLKPGVFTLKSPFKENFIGSLHVWIRPNMGFSPEETVAYALVRHAEWYLKIRDVDALRERAGAIRMKPQMPGPPMGWIEGIVRPTGEFTRDPEADGKPAILGWHEGAGDIAPSLGIEIRGPGVAPQDPAFRRTLLQSMVDSLAVVLELKRPKSGRPKAPQAEGAAYYRDHQGVGRAEIAKRLCSCGSSRHTQQCFDRLNKLADSFYRTQRSSFERLVREQTRKYPEINS